MTLGWQLQRGANPESTDVTTVHFAVWAPHARAVSVRIVGPGPASEHPLTPSTNGIFAGECSNVAPDARYLYVLDGRDALADPASRYQPLGVAGPSQVVDPGRFAWTDQDWKGLEMADLILYELHVGTFTEKGTYEGVCERLDNLVKLGVTGIELMPVAQFPGARNWGYDGVFPYAPQNTYGGPDGLKGLVNEAHARGVAVFLDVVYNHLGPQGNVLGRYGPYFTDRYKTPWGAAINFDGPDSDEVRRYFIDNALYWMSEYHIDGLRLDAVHAICDFSAYAILAEIKDAARELESRLNRRLLIVAESDLNDPRLVWDPVSGGYGLDGQWSDDFHHAVHVALTNEQQGYYADFDGLGSIQKALQQRFVLDGTYSKFRRRRHGAKAAGLPADRFVTFVQNHDQVGNRAAGDRLSTLVSLDRQKIAAFFSLMTPYVPLLFMGEEYGETNPFLYFVNHDDPELVEAVRKGRRSEFAAFGWADDVPDPQAEDTFLRSRLDPSLANAAPHDGLSRLYRDLIRIRRTEALLRPNAADVNCTSHEDDQWLAWRFDQPGDGTHFVAAVNLSLQDRCADLAVSGQPRWSVAISTCDERYGPRDSTAPIVIDQPDSSRVRVQIPTETAVLLRRTA